MTRKFGGTSGAHPAQQIPHPRSVAILETDALQEPLPDQPFAEGARDTVDPDLRHRMISEAAYRRYEMRGYADGNDVDDWLAAEADVDGLLVISDVSDVTGAH
jgi:hypothetical protein